VAYAAVGRFDDADRLYAAALKDLTTTSPFPYAWNYFARALMWTEQAGDRAKGEAFYAQALIFLPEFVSATIHKAELEVSRGDLMSAMVRLERIAVDQEPEAMALLGVLYVRVGDGARGWHEISLARQRFESLLSRHPLAFADHATEFYLGPGADAQLAWIWAQRNLENRRTDRAIALAIKAARASGHEYEACELLASGMTQSVPSIRDECPATQSEKRQRDQIAAGKLR
jgi:tetratricopeptide (TPR) repeat protein